MGFDKYMGPPASFGRAKWAQINYFLDRVPGKIQHWITKLLSLFVKEVFLKSATCAIPNYAMQMLCISSGLMFSYLG